MPELIIDFITSLDGYAAADGWPGWWGKEGPEYLAWLGKQPEANYTVLMGANTYRLMAGLATEGEPGTDALSSLSKITGSTGRERIYDGYPDVDLALVSARTFDGQLQLLDYVPTVLAGLPVAGR